jgi:type II secretory pathway component PulF
MPAPTLFTSGAGAYLGRVVPFVLLLGLAVGAFAYAPRLPPDAPLRRSFRSLGLSLPFVRVALYNGALATFADVLGTAVKAGLPVREALALSAEATPHPDFQKRAPEVIRQLDSGASLTAALAPLGLPHDFASQVATGETVGTLDQALPRLSQLYRERSQRATRRLLVGIGGIAFAIAAAVTALNIIQGYSSSLRGQEKLFERMERQ